MPRSNFGIYDYISSLYDKDETSKQIRTTPKPELREIQLSYAEVRIIQFILKLVNAHHVLEIGVLAGYSSSMIAQALPKTGKLIAVENNLEHYNLAVENLATFANVELIHGDGLEVINSQPEAHFDAIFIDANKKGYSSYFAAVDRVLKKGGVIIFDNTLMYGEVYNHPQTELGSSLDTFNRYLAASDKYESLIIPTDSGLTVALKL